MQPAEMPKFSDLITDVMGYYGKDASPFVLGLWWDACKGFAFEQIAKALNTHAKDAERGVFAPKVADVVRVLAGTTTDKAALAWGKTLNAMSAVGAYSDVCFDDPAIHAAVVDCGGWPKVCRSDLSELSYLQHRFCQSYKAYTERGEFEFPRLLGGDRASDALFAKRGMRPPPPAMVGDLERAKRVLATGGAGGPAITFGHVADLVVIPMHREAA